MTLGILTAVAFLLTAAKYVTKRLPFPRLDRAMMRLHKVSGIALLILTLLHAVLGWKLLHQRPVWMYLLGAILVLGVFLALGSHIWAKKIGMRWLTWHRFATALIFACLIAHVAVGLWSLASYRRDVAAIRIDNVDVSNVADGTYTGSCSVGYIRARVQVDVEDGTITAIELLEHRTERGKPAERITKDVLAAQTLDVDTVTGATNSSKVILKAIEDALSQGISKTAGTEATPHA